MSKMAIVDENGKYKTEDGSLKVVQSEHPVHKARVAIALDKGAWLYAPANGHSLGVYTTQRATQQKVEEFQKMAKLYLAPYGPQVVGRFIKRGELSLEINITRETING